MDKNTLMIAGVGVAAVVVIYFVFFRKGGKGAGKEGFQRQCLGGTCSRMQRSPVDYALKHDRNAWEENPHFQADPNVNYQPLDYGPVDFFAPTRTLQSGKMFDQYRQDWPGCGKDINWLQNDEKDRFDLEWIGDLSTRRILDDAYTPRFGKKGMLFTELSMAQVDPTTFPQYGGFKGLPYAARLM